VILVREAARLVVLGESWQSRAQRMGRSPLTGTAGVWHLYLYMNMLVEINMSVEPLLVDITLWCYTAFHELINNGGSKWLFIYLFSLAYAYLHTNATVFLASVTVESKYSHPILRISFTVSVNMLR
jgi:hypothetical protein